ncbi:MAG TPA: hypothetical protein VGD37_14665 [Kofleriaceae bacterium]
MPPIAAALLVASGAAADPQPGTSVVGVVQPRPVPETVVPARTPAPSPERELTAADVAFEPIPGYESGRTDRDETDSTWRGIGRGLLYVPKLALDVVLSPARAAIWAQDRYQLSDRYTRTFYNAEQTIGIYPNLSVDSALGFSGGAGFVHRDLFGDKEHLGAEFSIGNRYRQIYSASFATGDRLGKQLSLQLDAGYERRPHDAFYGIGNGARAESAAAPINPLLDPTSIESHYRQARARLSMVADYRPSSRVHIRPAAAVSELQFGAPDTGESLTEFYDTRGVVGWNGVRYGYAELELRWDSRRATTIMEPPAVYSAGELAAVFAGRMHRLDDGPDFWRYGFDAQKFLRLAEGPRVLIGHLHGEAVTGRRDDVPFTELPKLGGPTWLRGYALDQFRDRVAVFGSLAYEWDLSQWFSANVFVDAGRVYPELTDLSIDHLRMGYGLAIEAHRVESFVLEGSIGSSIDGGLFVNLSFNPVYDLDERVRRR